MRLQMGVEVMERWVTRSAVYREDETCRRWAGRCQLLLLPCYIIILLLSLLSGFYWILLSAYYWRYYYYYYYYYLQWVIVIITLYLFLNIEKLIFLGTYFFHELKIKNKTDNFNTKYLQSDINLDNDIKLINVNLDHTVYWQSKQ